MCTCTEQFQGALPDVKNSPENTLLRQLLTLQRKGARGSKIHTYEGILNLASCVSDDQGQHPPKAGKKGKKPRSIFPPSFSVHPINVFL